MDFHPVEAVLKSGLQNRISPGLAASIGLGQQPRWEGCFGQLGLHKSSVVTPFTIYDLASLTKVLCTTFLCAYGVYIRKIDLEESPFPAWPGITIRHLLEHTAGLPAHLPFYQHLPLGQSFFQNKALLLQKVSQTAPLYPPGMRTLYSDLGFIALGALLETRLNEKLDVVFGDLALRYFGTQGLRFVDLNNEKSHPQRSLVAPTGYCAFRNRWLWGEVNDANCYAMGGVSGHAGLFGSLKDMEQAVGWFAHVLQSNAGGFCRILRSFAMHRTQANRALGFDRPHKSGSTGRFISPDGVGHLGFTGVSFWIDPNTFLKGSFYILLTNRVHHETKPQWIQALRTQFHEKAYQALKKSDHLRSKNYNNRA